MFKDFSIRNFVNSVLQRSSQKRKAFTLAEILIVIMIIGFISVFVVPSLIKTVQDKMYTNQRKVFKAKMQESLRKMRVSDALSKRFPTTKDFVNELSKYMKITQVCDSDSLTSCFAEDINENELTVKYHTNDLNTAKDIDAPEDFYKLDGVDFDTTLTGVIFNNGSSAIIGYNPKCVVANSFDTTADDFYCMTIIYDVNGGSQGTNILNQDIGYINAITSADVDSEYIVGDITISKPFVTTLVTVSQCERMVNGNYPIDQVCKRNEYWASAVKKCYDQGKRLPTASEMTTIASRLYGVDVSENGTTGGEETPLTVEDSDLLEILPAGTYWTSEVDSANATTHAKAREFAATSSTAKSVIRNDQSVKAFCVNR